MSTHSLPLPTPVVRMPRGTAVSAQRLPVAADGSGHLSGRLASRTAFILAAAGAVVVTVLMRLAV